ncbi:MAG: phage tail tip lysozyme [Defluviitaleaceae bacterium]|nr:phage tail tip lysozyme [Defluviitaleaceae bacterium]
MTATPAIPNGTKDALGLLNHAIFKSFDAVITRVKSKLNIVKSTSLERPKKPDITFHSGRTDSGGGHNNRVGGNGAIPYHFHHTLGPHMPCCHSGPRQAASIINPYTGREINLGRPYVFQNQNYFSVNLVARALTVWDTMGASLSLLPVFPPFFNAGGSFSACNRGESAGPTLTTLGERFSFTYPTLPIIGTIRNNTFFNATGDSGGRLQLLCHTTQAELDPYVCYAYISLETLRAYMLSAGFFTGFAPNMPSSVWVFAHPVPLAEITSPRHNENFQVGDTLIVRASVQDVREAALTINGRVIEMRTELSGRNIVFAGYTLTAGDIGSLVIGVNAQNGQGIMVNLPTVRINAVVALQPNVQIILPQNGTNFYVGGSVTVEIDVGNATQSELTISGHRQSVEHSMEQQQIAFNPYVFSADDVGNVVVSVISRNEFGAIATRTINVQVAHDIGLDMMGNIAHDTTLDVSAGRRHSMTIMGQVLLNEGYEPAFVAGMLANIMREGSFGEFERSGTDAQIADWQGYMRYFVDNHDYRNRFSGRLISDVDATLLEVYNMITNAPQTGMNANNIFGIGIVQWTNRPRIIPLMQTYRSVAGDGRISAGQVVEAETLFMVNELASGQHVGGWGGVAWGSDLREVWRERNGDVDNETAAGDAGYIITRLYTRPGHAADRAAQRRTDAINIFRIMVG